MKFPLSNVALASIIANVRSQTGTLNEVESNVYQPQIIDIIHDALTIVFVKERMLLRRFYATTVPAAITTLPGGMNIIPFYDLEIAEVDTLMLSHSGGQIGLLSRVVYNSLVSLYTTFELSPSVFGIVDSTPTVNASTLYGIELIIGGNATTPTDMKLSYTRLPKKATSLSEDKLDIPDQFIPTVEAVACRLVIEKLRSLPPQQDVKIVEDLNAQVGGRK